MMKKILYFINRFRCKMKGHSTWIEVKEDKPTLFICGYCNKILGSLYGNY